MVEPKDTEVLDDSDDAILTLVTCYPFYFVGPHPIDLFSARAGFLHGRSSSDCPGKEERSRCSQSANQ